MKTSTLLFLLAVSIFAAACGNAEKTSDTALPNAKVTLETVSLSAHTDAITFTGNMEGRRRVNLSTKIMGPIISMPADEGAQVSAGQIVVRIKSDDVSAKRAQVKANLIEAQAALKNVEINYNRVKSLYENKTATRKEMDDMDMAYLMAKARVAAVEEMEKEVADVMGYGEIISPIQGFVVKKMAQEGDMAVPGMPLLVIEDLSVLQINTQVPESQIHLFKRNDKVRVLIDALPNSELTGIVDRINPGGNPASRQFEVKVILTEVKPEHRAMIKSGMYARVMLESETKSTMMIPANAVLKRGQLEGLFVVSDNHTALLRWIKTGRRIDDRIEVLAGIQENERIVISSDVKLTDGQKVEVAK